MQLLLGAAVAIGVGVLAVLGFCVLFELAWRVPMWLDRRRWRAELHARIQQEYAERWRQREALL